MFNSLTKWWSKQNKKNKNKNKKKTNKLKSIAKIEEEEEQLIVTPSRMLTDDKGPPIFLLHIKNYQLLYYVVMLFFTINLRMSYYFTRDRFYMWSVPIVVGTGFVFFRWRWRSNLVWFCIHLVMMMQNFFDLIVNGQHYLPKWFVVYSTAPLVICSVIENILFVLSNDNEMQKHIEIIRQRKSNNPRYDNVLNYNELRQQQRSDKNLRYKLTFMNLFVDKDVRDFYPTGFEIYMMFCAMFIPISGGGIAFRNCVTDIYGLSLWVMYVVSEDIKMRAYKKMFKLPSHIVKVIYILYAPPLFWINISFLVFMNILIVADVTRRDKTIFFVFLAFVNTVIYTNSTILDSCPLMTF